MNKGKILVLDDNQGIRAALKILLPPHFEEVKLISSPSVLVSAIETFLPDVILLDMNFNTSVNTGNEGLYWLTEIKKMNPDTEVVLFTAYADIALAVEGMRRGAFDFVVKPWDNDKLLATLDKACDKALKVEEKTTILPKQESEMYWGDSDAMKCVRRDAAKFAPTDVTVLITGENGTGKDMIAKEIQRMSKRSRKPMVCVDAGAITETLFESELFGHVKGAFTDAHTDHVGKFEQAQGGTLFLDEIGNIPLHLQAKLLRALQDRVITRVGDEKAIKIDIRLLCATNMNLEEMVRQGRFREDLYYRINTVSIHLPSLHERTCDIMPLSELFIREFNEKYNRHILGIDPSAETKMLEHPWNGNIRELRNCIEKAVILAEGDRLMPDDIQLSATRNVDDDMVETLEEAEERIIREAMKKCNGNLSLVAKALNISRPTLYNKLKKYEI